MPMLRLWKYYGNDYLILENKLRKVQSWLKFSQLFLDRTITSTRCGTTSKQKGGQSVSFYLSSKKCADPRNKRCARRPARVQRKLPRIQRQLISLQLWSKPLQLLSEGAAQRRELQNQTTDVRSNAQANSWLRLSRCKCKCRSWIDWKSSLRLHLHVYRGQLHLHVFRWRGNWVHVSFHFRLGSKRTHMSDQLCFFKNLRPRERGDHKLDVGAIGDIEVVNSIGSVLTLRDCLLVPGLKANFFSIPSVTKKGFHAVLTDNIVQFFRDDTLEMEGSREQAQLYHLDVTVTVQHETLHALVSRAAPIQVWHERFGHLNRKTIEKMVRKILLRT